MRPAAVTVPASAALHVCHACVCGCLDHTSPQPACSPVSSSTLLPPPSLKKPSTLWHTHGQAGMMGAVAVIADREMPDALLPVVVVDDVGTALGRLADAFYERPSRRMRTIGMVGSYGKTTSAWLARGMFEETGERCGMIGAW